MDRAIERAETSPATPGAAAAADHDDGPALAIRNRVTLHLVAPLTFLTFLNSLDRVNVSFAALQIP